MTKAELLEHIKKLQYRWKYHAIEHRAKRCKEATGKIMDEEFEGGWHKMREDAVEGVVCILPGSVAYVDERDDNTLKQYIIDNFKAGDKVKIVIVKED